MHRAWILLMRSWARPLDAAYGLGDLGVEDERDDETVQALRVRLVGGQRYVRDHVPEPRCGVSFVSTSHQT